MEQLAAVACGSLQSRARGPTRQRGGELAVTEITARLNPKLYKSFVENL
jgi:hypothetical protein